MDYLNNSFFLKLINKLDIKEDSPVIQAFNSSFFLNLLNQFFAFTQNLFSKITEKSRLLWQIDLFILGLITLLLASLLFASAKTIGLIAALCFAGFLVKLFLKKGEKLSFKSFDVQIFVYFFIISLSVAFSPMLFPALKGYVKLIVYLSSYLVFFNVLKDKPEKSYYLLGILALTAFAESLTAIYQNFVGIEALATWQDKTNLNANQVMTRVYGTLQPFNPNLLAGYLVATVSSTVGMASFFAVRKKFRLSLFCFAAFFAILLAIMFTGSRGSYLGVGAMMTAFVMITGHIIWQDYSEKIWLKKLWFYAILLGGFAALALILTNPALQHRVLSIFAFREDSSNSFRMNVYIASAKMFLDNWLIGIGPGNEVFRLTYGFYMKAGFDALGAYSAPLEIAIESGIFALLAFFWLLVSMLLRSARVIMYSENIEQKILVACCLMSIIGIMTHGLVDTIFFRPQIQLLFWLFVAMLGTNQKFKN